MLNEIIISICIPTYNRAHTLTHLLSSIARESKRLSLESAIEVIVSDNASKDNTEELISFFSNKIKNIKYIRLEENKGFGVNITNAVHNASGRYCWLMGSDEILCEGALLKVINAFYNVDSAPDIILGNTITDGLERKFFFDYKQVESVYSINNFSDFINNCTELSSCFGFISTIIIKKEIFTSDAIPVEYIGHPYTHMLRIIYFIRNSECRLKLLGYPLVETGTEANEWNAIILNHFKLDYQTGYAICHDIFNDKPDIVKSFSLLLKRQYSPFKVVLSRSCATRKEWDMIKFVLNYFDVKSNKTLCDFFVRPFYIYLKKAKGAIKYVKSKV